MKTKPIADKFRESKNAVIALPGLQEVEFREDETIVDAGTLARNCYLVVSGIVIEQVEESEGAFDIVRLVREGGLCGLDRILACRSASYQHTYRAATPVKLVELPRAGLEKLCKGADAAAVLSDVVRLTREIAGELSLRGLFLRGNNGSERIGTFLDHFGWSDPPPVKWKDIANYLGMNTCAFSRSLARLRRTWGL